MEIMGMYIYILYFYLIIRNNYCTALTVTVFKQNKKNIFSSQNFFKNIINVTSVVDSPSLSFYRCGENNLVLPQ